MPLFGWGGSEGINLKVFGKKKKLVTISELFLDGPLSAQIVKI